LGGALLIDNPLPDALSKAIEVFAEVFVVQGAGDAVCVEIEKAKEIAHNLEISVMCGYH